MPEAEARAPVGIDALRAVVIDLEDWSKELGAIDGFERMAAQALKSAGQIRAAVTTVQIKLETLDKVRLALDLPEGTTRPGYLSAVRVLKERAAQFERSVEQYVPGDDSAEAEIARLRWEVAKLKGGNTDGSAEPV